METVNSRYGRIERGDTIPYGTLATADPELKKAYYTHGIRNDDDWHALPTWGPDPVGVEADPTEALFRQEVVRVVRSMLDGLTLREAQVLRMRFGIELGADYTLEEIGQCFDVTRERIRQIEAKAMRKLKHPSRDNVLRALVEDEARRNPGGLNNPK